MKTARMRMFAGPNGSGKSTVKKRIEKHDPNWLGVYINPDDIENEALSKGSIEFGRFKIKTTEPEVIGFLRKAGQLKQNGLSPEVSKLKFANNALSFANVELNSYFISALADFLHERLAASKTSFSFETVMSHAKKLELLKYTQSLGFRNYLYYVATEDPEININRVKIRVSEGGHHVPKDKIVSRYYRSLENVLTAISYTSRAFVYDNSGAEVTLIAQITDGKSVKIENSNIPVWFKKYIFDKGL